MLHPFEKGHKKKGGIKKGTKHKGPIIFNGLTEENKAEVIKQAMILVKKGNVTIINKLLDKLVANAIPKDENGNAIMPEIKFNVIGN